MTRSLGFLLLALAVAAGWMLVLPPAPVAQPVAFNHAKHATMGCVACHRGVEATSRAGLPDGAACANCHATPPPAPGAEAAWRGLAQDRRIEWVRVTRVPDHVMFSHRRHVALARLDCATCHADVGQRSTPPPSAPVRLDMDACLSCHQKEGVSEDCATCHR